MKPFRLQWLLAVQVLFILWSFDSPVLSVEASSRRLLLEGLTPVQLNEHYDSESAPPRSLFLGETNPAELHNERVALLETLRTYRTHRGLLGSNSNINKERVNAKAGKKSPKGAPPPPKNSRRISLPPPPPTGSYPPPPRPKKCL